MRVRPIPGKQLVYLSRADVDGDLGEIIVGKVKEREDARQRIVAMNLGLGLVDVAVAILVYERAVARGIGPLLPL